MERRQLVPGNAVAEAQDRALMVLSSLRAKRSNLMAGNGRIAAATTLASQ